MQNIIPDLYAINWNVAQKAIQQNQQENRQGVHFIGAPDDVLVNFSLRKKNYVKFYKLQIDDKNFKSYLQKTHIWQIQLLRVK